MSCILYRNPSSTLILIDIPRSVELAQGASCMRKLFSTPAIEKPYRSIEPKSENAKLHFEPPSISDLLIQKHLELALAELKEHYHGEWCLPRTQPVQAQTAEESTSFKSSRKRKGEKYLEPVDTTPFTTSLDFGPVPAMNITLFKNVSYYSQSSTPSGGIDLFLPPRSAAIYGDIETTMPMFIKHAPRFDFIIMDPPWPNRSARRKSAYGLCYNVDEITTLLRSIPIRRRLRCEGYVGIWITNRKSFKEVVLELFKEWGLTLVEEVIWLKVTTSGEPVCALDSVWKKPYEILLVAAKQCSRGPQSSKCWKGRRCLVRRGKTLKSVNSANRRVIFAVPELHSRKPSLKILIEQLLQKISGEYRALEVFARNMTEGWWAWGNEVLKYQGSEHWTEL